MVEICPVGATLEDIQFLLERTTQNLQEITDWYTNFMNENPQAQVSREQLKVTYYKFFPEGRNPEEFCKQAFDMFDIDSLNTIDLKDATLGCVMVTPTQKIADKLSWMFKHFDIEGEGSIEKIAVVDAVFLIRYFNFEYDESELTADDITARLFARYGQDTENGRLCKREFIDGWLSDELLCSMLNFSHKNGNGNSWTN